MTVLLSAFYPCVQACGGTIENMKRNTAEREFDLKKKVSGASAEKGLPLVGDVRIR